MRRGIVGLLVALSLAAGACAGSEEPEPLASRTDLPTAAPSPASPADDDPWATPEPVTTAYVEAVYERLGEELAAATDLMIDADPQSFVPAEVLAILAATHDDEQFARVSVQWAEGLEAGDFSGEGLTRPVGPILITDAVLLHASRVCIVFEGRFDTSRRDPDSELDGLRTVQALTPGEAAQHNPTPWRLSWEVLPDLSDWELNEEDPCASAPFSS